MRSRAGAGCGHGDQGHDGLRRFAIEFTFCERLGLLEILDAGEVDEMTLVEQHQARMGVRLYTASASRMPEIGKCVRDRLDLGAGRERPASLDPDGTLPVDGPQ